ncbi:lipid A export permease/ATP-binding protein MsbA [Aestuariirhabdus litorea]|uniref:Lipid A export permease/ATP-binding protein MsbA n=1 Tax=Aestuariirhabdus litorea TaxID=2528527 RepID=A0A3P3VHZ5_9GAMM|nr:lipid A export permease/ATP-binding protein MsbA [Aestuariirhabdus litorea]RRJ82345.1 lipid A export permease/ATP-binding protein MsbA [Aestuariirhabdus litorea]RWW92510.1 lipid A export permease/ATP-binding protein MsbA [Endozoicomonadaceae bacterium GTF-13]
MASPEQKQQTSSIRVYLRLLGYVKPYIVPFVVSILGFAFFAATQPGYAKMVEYFIEGLEGADERFLYLVPLAVVALAILRGLGSFLGNYFLAMVSQGLVHDLRIELFNKLVTLPSRYFDDNNSGHLISRITYNVTMVTAAATDAIKVVVREGLTVLFLLGYLLWTNWKLTLVFLAILPVIALVVGVVGRRLRKLSHKIQDAMGDVTHVTSETIKGYRVVRSFGGEAFERSRFYSASANNLRQAMKMVKVSAITTPVLQFLVISAMGAIMFLVLYMRDTSSTAALISFVVAAGMLPKPIRQLSEVYGNIQKGIAACETIFEQLDETQEVDQGDHEAGRVEGRIEVRNLSFAYNDAEDPVLKGLNFIVEPGQTIALVGRSGSGKSTLASLIPRFYNHHQGEILIDGVPVERYTLTSLRRQIALVNQQVSLFNDSVANNIAYGDLQGTPDEDIKAAAESAYAMEFIKDLPEGLHTLIGEDGVRLSGGQRQRLAIARAILKDAPILILDEATSALDTESERYIQAALDEVMKNRTTVVIAHRLSTIEQADRILVMDQGRIIESGTHEELLERGEHYARLHSQQFQDAVS